MAVGHHLHRDPRGVAVPGRHSGRILKAHCRLVDEYRPTKALVCDAWKLAVGQPGLPRLHHSDQGSPYTSDDYLHLLEQDEVIVRMSDVGRYYDNAMQESFWGTLKTECADRPFPSRAGARQAIFEYIEIWYNRQRRHSALGDLSPAQYEQLQLHCP